MGKFIRIFVLLLAAGWLGGCILQSKTALFQDSDGALILGSKKVKVANYELSSLTWKKGNTVVEFQPVGHHYRVFNGAKYATAEFIALSNGNYVLQFDEGKGAVIYVLARPFKNEVYLHLLTCDHLKKQNVTGILFVKDNCFIDVKYGRLGFEDLLKHLPIANLKLVKE
jgi:hypothetical protein